jgi:hypothetical protein
MLGNHSQLVHRQPSLCRGSRRMRPLVDVPRPATELARAEGCTAGCTGTGPELATLASRLSAPRHTEPGGAAGCSLSCVYRQRVCFDERSSGRENRPVHASRLRLVNHHTFPGATGISGCNIKTPAVLTAHWPNWAHIPLASACRAD